MLSSFHGIEVGKRGLQTSNTALQTVGHNLSNIETEGYTRQRVTQETMPPLFDPSASRPHSAGQIGQGPEVEAIMRIRNQAIDNRLIHEFSGSGFWQMKKDFLHQVDRILNEPGQPNIRTLMDQYWASWEKVSQDPSEMASRMELIQRTHSMTNAMNHTYESLRDLRTQTNEEVANRVQEVNRIADEIAGLNVQIIQSESLGDRPNDMYDRRDLLLDRLSKIVNVTLERGNQNEFIVYIGADELVQGEEVSHLRVQGNPQNTGYWDVYWETGDRQVKLLGGEIAGLIETRDEDLFQAMQDLDTLAANMVQATNALHRDGYGLNLETDRNFFQEIPLAKNANGNYDFNNDGQADGTAIFAVTGTERLRPKDLVGQGGVLTFADAAGNPIAVNYAATDRVEDVITAINDSDAGVSASLTPEGSLTLKARNPKLIPETPFVLGHIEDSGNFLVGYSGILQNAGAAGAFDSGGVDAINALATQNRLIDFTPERGIASWIALDGALEDNPGLIAASGGVDTTGDGNPNQVNGVLDNRTAIRIAELRHTPIMVDQLSTPQAFFRSLVGDMATRSERAQDALDRADAVVYSLESTRQQTSGVNIDEEMSRMIMFQHAYNASARLVSTVDRLLDVLMGMGA